MKHTYIPRGTCSRRINLEIEDGIVVDLKVEGGCNGNLQGIAALCKGRPAREVATALKGIKYGNKPTSCPDQVAQALLESGEI